MAIKATQSNPPLSTVNPLNHSIKLLAPNEVIA